MKDQQKAEDLATQRIQWLFPLLASGLDAAKVGQLKLSICEQTGLSERTIRRYLANYRANGFSGLKPKAKQRKTEKDTVPAPLLEQAILLRREVPSRSVSQIIQILEWEDKVKPGQLKRSTLQEKLTAFRSSIAIACGRATLSMAPFFPLDQVVRANKPISSCSSMMQHVSLSPLPSARRSSNMAHPRPFTSTTASSIEPNGWGELVRSLVFAYFLLDPTRQKVRVKLSA